MPKIVRFYQLGGPENLKFEDEPSREPGRGEVKLRVQAAGLNRGDSMYYHGQYIEQPKLPSRLGYEVSGVVAAVGEGVDPSLVGTSVATIPGYSQNRYGSLAEEAIVPADAVAEYPSNLSVAEGAAIWMQYLTAYGALVHFGGVRPGDFVAIPAASSSVGLAAIQIVRDAGATAIALTRTSAKRDALLKLGAHHVIATSEDDYVARIREITGGLGVRLTFDPVGGPFVQKLVAAAAAGGVVFEYGVLSPEPTPFPFMEALPKGVAMRGYILLEITQNAALRRVATKYISNRLADGRFKPVIAKTFGFADTIEAYRYLESNQQLGKIVITFP